MASGMKTVSSKRRSGQDRGCEPKKRVKGKACTQMHPISSYPGFEWSLDYVPMPRSCGKHSHTMGLPSPSGPAAYSAFLCDSSAQQELTISPALERVPLLSSPLALTSSITGWAFLGTRRFPCSLQGDGRLVPLLQDNGERVLIHSF